MNFLWDCAHLADMTIQSDINLPDSPSLSKVLASSECEKWHVAVLKELAATKEAGTWELVLLTSSIHNNIVMIHITISHFQLFPHYFHCMKQSLCYCCYQPLLFQICQPSKENDHEKSFHSFCINANLYGLVFHLKRPQYDLHASMEQLAFENTRHSSSECLHIKMHIWKFSHWQQAH